MFRQYFSVDNITITRLCVYDISIILYVYDFLYYIIYLWFGYDSIDVDDVFDNHRYLMKKHSLKKCFDYSKQTFFLLLRALTTRHFGE